MSVGTALLAPVGRIGAQIAFCGFLFRRIPDCPVRSLRTGFNALLAADTFLLVDSPYVAIGSIHVTGARRTILNTQRRDALPAYRHNDIVGIFGK